jgi:hypothetical protein
MTEKVLHHWYSDDYVSHPEVCTIIYGLDFHSNTPLPDISSIKQITNRILYLKQSYSYDRQAKHIGREVICPQSLFLPWVLGTTKAWWDHGRRHLIRACWGHPHSWWSQEYETTSNGFTNRMVSASVMFLLKDWRSYWNIQHHTVVVSNE